jgi:predicted alpha/beta superfamily hydrolase
MRAIMNVLRVVVFVPLIASSGRAQNNLPAPWKTDTLQSAKLGEQRTIFTSLPDGYAAGTEKYPVLVLLDANDLAQFNLAVAHAAFLRNRNAAPPLIIVGITNAKDRTHDLTPTATGSTLQNFRTAGGAGAFADYVIDEVLPLVRSRYRTQPTTILAGHSFGGLFALDVAAARPDVFRGVIAMSPALWWNDSAAVVTYADAIARSGTSRRIFVTSGGLEPAIDRPTQRFAHRLDSIKPANVAFAYRHYPNDTHGLTPAPSLVDGLRFVFEPISMSKLPLNRLSPTSDSATIMNAIRESENIYRDNARSIGLPDRLPEGTLNQLGYVVLQQLRKPDWAIPVFKRNVTLYPESANVYDSLGDAYLAKGDTTAARAQFTRAVDTATRTGVPVAPETREKLARLERRSTGSP